MKKIFCLAFSVIISLSFILSISVANAGDKENPGNQLIKVVGKVVSVNKSAGTFVLKHDNERIVFTTDHNTVIIVNSRQRSFNYVPTGIAVFVEYLPGQGGKNIARSIDDGTGTPLF